MRLLVLLLTAFVALPAFAQEADTTYRRVPIDVSVWDDLSLGHALGDTTRPVLHHLALHLTYGSGDRLEGVALGLLGSAYRDEAWGLQLSGLGSVTGGRMSGVQAAGLGSISGGPMRGVQLGGLGAIAGERLTGIQLGGLGAIAGDEAVGVQFGGLGAIAGEGMTGIQAGGLGAIAGAEMRGIQTGGLGAVAGNGMRGVQSAGLAAITGDDLLGIQTAGLAAIVGEDVRGLQSAGLIAITGGTMRGLQIAPITVSAHATGIQIGVVNVAGTHRGLPIGLVSLVGDVPVYGEAWADETGALQLGVRSGSAVVTNRFALGVRPFGEAAARLSVTVGLGIVRPVSERVEVGVEATAEALFSERLAAHRGGLFRLRVPVSVIVSPRLALIAGPSVALYTADEPLDLTAFPTTGSEGSTRVWAGGFVGARIPLSRAGR